MIKINSIKTTKDIIRLGEPVKDARFPVWAKAISEKLEKRGIIDLESSSLGKDRKESEKISLAFNSVVKQTGETINIRYLSDLPKRAWFVYSDKVGRRVILKQNADNAGEAEPKFPVAIIVPIAEAA